MVRIHVSKTSRRAAKGLRSQGTIRATRVESNTNHASLIQFLLYLKAPKRKPSSKTKKMQKMFSTTMKIGSASRRVFESFKSLAQLTKP